MVFCMTTRTLLEFWNDGDYSQTSYPLVADCLIDELHHDIISTWTDIWAEELWV